MYDGKNNGKNGGKGGGKFDGKGYGKYGKKDDDYKAKTRLRLQEKIR
jgi:hypothetical protein